MAEACARLTSCVDFRGEFSSPGGFDACVLAMGDLAVDADEVASCVLAAGDCTDAATCLNAGDAPSECDAAATPRRGDGAIARNCRGGLSIARDCAAAGLDCVEDDAGQTFCGRSGDCTESVCDGNTLLLCLNGARYVQECGSLICQRAPELGDNAVCAGEGEPCEGRIFECDGDVAVSCRFGRIHRETCGPGLCSTSDGVFCRQSPECESLPRCEGTELVHCVGGVPSRIDCGQFGQSCESNDGEVRCR